MVRRPIELIPLLAMLLLFSAHVLASGESVNDPKALKGDSPIPASNTEARIDQLIQSLGSDEFRIREESEKALRAIGMSAFVPLEAARESDDVEVRLRARYLVDEMRAVGIVEGSSPGLARLLKRYADRAPDVRRTLIDYFRDFAPYDGTLELVRIARFEPDESLAKTAALFLMERTGDLPLDRIEPVLSYIQQQSTPSDRPAMTWLRLYADSVRNPQPQLPRWEELLRQHAVPIPAGTANSREPTKPGETGQVGKVDEDPVDVQRLLSCVLIDMYVRSGQATQAEDLIQKTMGSFVGENADQWLWINFLRDRKQFRPLSRLKETHAKLIADDPRLAYVIAEAFREIQDEAMSKTIADAAFELPQTADARVDLARRLQNNQGQFDWAAREFQGAIDESAPGSRENTRARILLALMYHDLAKDQEAADTLDEVVKTCKTSPAALRSLEENGSLNEILASVCLYRAEAARVAGETEAQISFLQRGFEVYPQNIDILIAMHHVANASDEWKKKAKDALTKARSEYEQEIANLERSLGGGIPDSLDVAIPSRLPTAYNDYAWLVANTEGDFQLALKHSQHSLELSPGESAYLDTLARCYYAVGDIENAVKYQRFAVERSPNIAQMQRQLELFKKIASTKAPPP